MKRNGPLWGERNGSERNERGKAKLEIQTYPKPPTKIQHNPKVHPTVVSPRKLRQLSTRSAENGFPAASAAKRIRSVARM